MTMLLMRRIGLAACMAVALLTGCKFSPEQLLLPEAPEIEARDAAVSGRRTSATSAAGSSSAGSSATPTSSQRKPARPMSGEASDAGSGQDRSASMDAGAAMQTKPDMKMEMSSAGARATETADAGSTPNLPAGAQDPTCDFHGVWISRQVAVGLALEQPQYMNTWGYYEIEQSGRDFVVTKHIDCGGEVLGSGTVTLSRATLEGNVQHNMQNGRKGTLALMGGKCELDIAHYWSVRGGEELRFLPNPTRDSTMSMSELMKLKPLPTPSMPEGAIDLENDGELGAAGQVDGIVSGTRNSVQRDWDRWFTAPGYEITPSMDFTSEVTVRMEYESEESVMAPRSGLLTTPTESTDDYAHIMTFRFLGRTLEDPRAKAIVHTDPVETCYAVQDAMPAAMLPR